MSPGEWSQALAGALGRIADANAAAAQALQRLTGP
jgi:hypothetical protein